MEKEKKNRIYMDKRSFFSILWKLSGLLRRIKEWQSNLGPVNTNPMHPVVPEKAPIKARGERFGDSK
ncbi:MAG: hypothetical protein AB2563_18500, partial [Candidatus Thiodiazotropha endolucinida]